jgi:hypothetical protein
MLSIQALIYTTTHGLSVVHPPYTSRIARSPTQLRAYHYEVENAEATAESNSAEAEEESAAQTVQMKTNSKSEYNTTTRTRAEARTTTKQANKKWGMITIRTGVHQERNRELEEPANHYPRILQSRVFFLSHLCAGEFGQSDNRCHR